MVVASGDTPAISGTSRTSRPSSPRMRTKFAVKGSDSSDLALEVERVGEEHLSKECRQVRRGRSALAVLDLGAHPVRAADDREVLGQLDVEPLDHFAQRLAELVDSRRRRTASPSAARSRRTAAARAPVSSCRSAWGGRSTRDEAPRWLPQPSRFDSESGPTSTYRQRSRPPSVESVRDFGIPVASGSSPTVMPSPTKRRKFDHITIEMGRR